MTSVDSGKLDAFADKVLVDAAAGFSAVMVVLGDKLGLYRAMAGAGPLTAAACAARAGLAERYVREWLNNQAAGGYVGYDPAADTYELPDEHAAVLAEEEHPAFMQGTFQFVPVFGRSLPALQEAFRSGGGVPWSDYDPELAQALERFLGPTYRDKLVPEWIPAVPGLAGRLAAGGRVADLGCGSGLTTVLMAEAFPASRFWGFDTDLTALARAGELAAGTGVADRTEFLPLAGQDLPVGDYDLVTTFNCLHDMGDPGGVAARLRRALAPGGVWLLVEPRAGDAVEDNLTPFGRMTYGGSTMLCIPSALAQPGGTALGAQAGEARLREVLTGAGFTSVVRRADSGLSMVFEVRR